MAKFEIYGNDGKKYEIESESMDSAMDVLDKHLGTDKELKNTEQFGRLAVSPQRLMALSKGIPGVGQFIPEPDLAKSDPLTNKGLNLTGNIMAMGAPTAAVSSGLARSGLPGLIPEMAGQAALGFGADIGDKVAQKGFDTSREDVKDAGINGILQGVAGPLLGKAFSPSFNSNRYTAEQLAHLPESHLETMLRPSAAREAARAVIEHPLVTGGAGAVASFMTGGMHPVLGGILGAAGPTIARHYASNKAFHNPSTQDILNALMQTSGAQVNQGR